MRNYLVMVGIFMVLNFDASSQFDLHLDSIRVTKLKRQLSALRGTRRVDCLNEIGQHYIYFTFTFRKKYQDSVVTYTNRAKSEAKKIGYTAGYAISLLSLATIEINTSSNSSSGDKEAISLLREAQNIARSTENKDLLGSVFRTWGELYIQNSDPARFDMLNKSLEYFKMTQNHDEIANTAGLLADEYMMDEKYGEALKYCELSIKSGVKSTSKFAAYGSIARADALLHLAVINEAAGDYGSALKYIHESEKYQRIVYGDSSMFYDIGEFFQRQGHYDSAYNYFTRFVEKFKDHPFGKMKIGEIYLSNNKVEQALNTFLELKDRIGHFLVMIKNFTRVYVAKGDFKTAAEYAKKWLKYVNRNNPKELLEIYSAEAQIYKGLGRLDSAFHYQQLFGNLSDSFSSKKIIFQINNELFARRKISDDEENAIGIAVLQKNILIRDQLFREQGLLKDQQEARIQLLDKDNKIKEQQLIEEDFLKEQKEARIALLKKDNKLLDRDNLIKTQQLRQESTIKKVLFGGLMVLMLTGFFIYRNLSLKRKNEKLKSEKLENDLRVQELVNEKEQAQLQQQATELEMQALRAQMNPHFIFNCLSSINKYIVKNETVSASDYLTRFSRLIRMVLVNSQKSLIKLEDELDMLKLYLDMERLRFNNSFDYTITFVNAIEPANVFIPPMLMQPFCENAIWHGFMHKEGKGKLDIAISKHNDSLFCSIKDNGVGREKAAELKDKSAERQKSLGLKITNNRLALLDTQNGEKNFYEMSDIKDKDGRFSGTQVDFRIRYRNFVEDVKA